MNGKNTRILKYLFLTVMIAAVLTGCTTFDSFEHAFLEEGGQTTSTMPTITIGVLEPQTGSNSARGKEQIRGIELANSIYSNVDGYRIVLSKVDTQSKVSTARTAVQGLIEMKPVAIIGSAGDAVSLVASEYIDDAGIPTITPSATNPLITQTSTYYFRACITESQMGEGLAEYAYQEVGARNIGLVSLKNDTSTAQVIDGIESKIKKLAGKRSKAITSVNEITTSDEDLQAAVDAIRKQRCDVCFVSLGTEVMDKFLTLAEEAGLSDTIFLGTGSCGSSDFVSMMSKHPDIKIVFPYVSVMTDPDGDSESGVELTEEAQLFQIEYQNKYGADAVPTEDAALGYDAYLLLVNAIHNADSMEGSDIREAMLALKDLKAVTGVFSFDDRGNVVRTVNLSTIKDGNVVPEYVTNSEAEAKSLDVIEPAAE